MPYFGIEDGFELHPKVVAAGNSAIGAWVRMGAWSMGHGTNGFIPNKIANTFATKYELKRLQLCNENGDGIGLLEQTEQNGVKGYMFHDWTQPSVETIRRKREVRAEAGRKGGIASGASRRAKRRPPSYEANEANREANAQANQQAKRSTEDIDINVTTYVGSAPYVSNAPARDAAFVDADFETATSERGLQRSSPVTIGATRLVATVIPNGTISPADRTILRIKASESICSGRSEDDVGECLRIWLTKPELGPNALLCCLTEVDKRKLNGHALSGPDRKAAGFIELGRRMDVRDREISLEQQQLPRKEIT